MPIIQVDNGYIYKKSTKKTKNKSAGVLLFFLIAMIIVTSCFFVFSKFNLISIFNMNKFVIYEQRTYFAVSVCDGDNIEEISNQTNLVKMQDGAGFVYKTNGKFFLIANVYSSKSDAENVAQKNSSYETKVVEIAFDRLVLSSKYTSEQIQTLKYSIEMVDRFFETVSDISISFDRGEILDAEVRQKLQLFREKCQLDKETLNKSFKDNGDVVVTYVKIFQSEVISNLSSAITSQNLSSDVKYILCSTLSSFETLQKNVKK